jgi:hypothetical protein
MHYQNISALPKGVTAVAATAIFNLDLPTLKS